MKGMRLGFFREACFTVCSRERNLARNCWWSLLSTVLIFGSAHAAFAQDPGWSRGIQLMSMNIEECKQRARGALKASGYRLDGQGGSWAEDHYFAGTRDRHAAAIACNMTSNNYMWINVFVASNDGRDVAGAERVKLQGLIERPGAVTGGGGGGGGEGRCQGVTYGISVLPIKPRPYEQITVSFTAPSDHDERAWIGIFPAGENPPKNYLDWKYVGAKDQCFGAVSLRAPAAGSYSIYFFIDSGYDKIAARANFTVQGSAQTYGVGGGGCGLGRVWNIVESGHNFTWTRRGNSNVFDVTGTINGNPFSAEQVIEIRGNKVFINRYRASDGNTCNFEGTIQSDGKSATGTYDCTRFKPTGPWSAIINCN